MREKVRLLHVLTTLDIGGAELQTLAVASRLPKERFEIAVAWLKGGGELAPRYEAAGIRPISLGGALRFAPHVVHTHMQKADAAGVPVAKLRRAALVSTKHNEDVYLRFPPYAAAARAVAAAADRIIVISDAVLRFFAPILKLPAARFTRIHHGLPPPSPPPPGTREAVRRELGIPPEAPVVLAVARLAVQKGLDVLLRALPPGVFAVLAGRGEEEADLRALARQLGLLKSVIFAGLRTDVPRLLAAADLFALPSRFEGFGLAALEAMAAGLPVVATRAGALPEVVADGETGLLVPSGEASALRAAIEALLGDPARAAAMGRAGRERAAREFPIEGEVAAHECLYLEVLR